MDGWTSGRKSPGDPILRAPAVLIIIFLLTHLLHNELDLLIYMANISGLAALLRICSSLSIFKLLSFLMRYGCDSCDGLDGTIPGPIVGPTTSYTKIKDETGTDSYYPANLTAAGISFLKSQKKQTLSGLHIFPAKTFQIKRVNFAISDFMTNCTLDNLIANVRKNGQKDNKCKEMIKLMDCPDDQDSLWIVRTVSFEPESNIREHFSQINIPIYL